jgi:hypothetical protein
MARTGTAPLILTTFILATAGAAGAPRGEDCLGGPNGQSPQGKHWYYRIDRESHRKCWYLGELNKRRAAAQTNTRRKLTRPPEPSEEPEEEAAPAPARAAASEPVPSERSPETVPSAAVAAPPPEPARVAAADPQVATMLGARPVTTERVRYDPAPPKPPEAPKPKAAAPAPAPAAASVTGASLPAALFGIALLLAVVGIILVRARSRAIKIHRPAASDFALRASAGLKRAVARAASESGRPRRSLSEILAQAEDADASDRMSDVRDQMLHAEDAGSHPSSDIRHLTSARRDIAAATLQPAIDPLEPEPIEPAPDVEQSLRALLAEWERRAA